MVLVQWFINYFFIALRSVLLVLGNLSCLDPNTIKIYKNTIVDNFASFSTTRKRQPTQCYNKVAIWVSNQRQFDGDHYASQWNIVYCISLMLKKFLVFWHLYCICICTLRCITFYFCSEIYYGYTQIQYKIYSNKIVNNLSKMRKL